jgi:hypothetical protein
MKTNMRCGIILLGALATLVASVIETQAALINATLNSRDFIRGQSQNTTTNPLGYFVDGLNGNVGVGGASGTRTGQNVVVGFLLPVLDGPITSATFSMTIASNSGTTTQIDLYGLNTTNPDATGTSLFFNGETDGTQTELLDAYSVTSTVSGTPSANVTAFLSSLYTGVNPNQVEVFFRLNPDRDNFSNINRLTFDTATATLQIETVPEPSSLSVLGISSLGMLICFRSRRNLVAKKSIDITR